MCLHCFCFYFTAVAYSSSVTGSSQVFWFVWGLHAIARCENQLSGAAPCQCSTFGAISAIEPSSMRTAAFPRSGNNPHTAINNCPPVWLCQLLRQPGSKMATLDTGTFRSLLLVKGASHDLPENSIAYPCLHRPRESRWCLALSFPYYLFLSLNRLFFFFWLLAGSGINIEATIAMVKLFIVLFLLI